MSTLQDKLAELSPERRASVMARADELIAEELTLRQLSEALNLPQNTSVEDLAAQWLQQASKRHIEKTEDMARLNNMRTSGGISHDEMMRWLDDLAR